MIDEDGNIIEEDDEYDEYGTRLTKDSSSPDGDKGLSKTKLGTKDYVKRAQSAKDQKKGKYGVTVPKPFGFDLRDKTKTKTIRERKIDAMVEE